MKKVLIGCPTHDAKVHALWANSVMATVALGARIGIHIEPYFVPGNALIHSARNEIVMWFLKNDFTDLVFIDADISWRAEDFFKLLNHDVDAVGGTYPYKTSELHFVMKMADDRPPEMADNGLMAVQGLGMGFFRLTRKAAQGLWDCSKPYKRKGTDLEFRAVFELPYIMNLPTDMLPEETGEDIAMCLKLPEVWLDPTILLTHSGDRMHFAEPLKWLDEVKAFRAKQAEEAGVILDPDDLTRDNL